MRWALRILLTIQDTPGAPIKASDASCVLQLALPLRPTLDVLARAGMLDDDRLRAVVSWFQRQIADLPAPMRTELLVWFEVMDNASQFAPRSLPRHEHTIRHQTASALPYLTRWAAHQDSLRDISRVQVLDALASSGNQWMSSILALRSIFRILRGRKLIFGNPTNRIPTHRLTPNIPMPLNPAVLRRALGAADPAGSALAGLLIFHGVRLHQLRDLQLVDVHDGRLHIGGQIILLADAAQTRLSSYLDHRAIRWPNTANPHVFINQITANQTTSATSKWVNARLGVAAQLLREDRIVDEITATGGDLMRICTLFGMTVDGAQRYAAVLNHPELSADR